MFKIGDKIVYPMHGAGIIESIEEKEILGDKRRYFILRMPIGEMKLMIPIASVQEIGLRKVIDEESVTKVFDILEQREEAVCTNWNKRYRSNLEKIKSGNIYELAEVVRNLSLRDREKGLSTGEKRMLDNARQILISELVLAKDSKEDNIKNLLEESLA